MQSEIKNLFYKAKENYLTLEEIKSFKNCAASLVQRLETYELLRTQEINIFQSVANEILKSFPQEQQETLERVLKHWLSVLRYCAMAMLMNNPEFLQRRVLEWLVDLVQVHQTQKIDMALYHSLQSQLQNLLTDQQLALLQPFLEQAKETLLGTSGSIQLQL